MCYESSRGPPPMGTSKMWLREFVALTGDAYQGLLRYVLSHDLTDEIFWYGPVEDPLAYAVDDSYQVKREYVDDLMLRVVDVEAAVNGAARGSRCAGGRRSRSRLAMRLRRGTRGPGGSSARARSSARGRLEGTSAELSMEAATFAAVYDGFMKASDAVRSGLAEASDPNAALLADRMFACGVPAERLGFLLAAAFARSGPAVAYGNRTD